MGKLTFRGGIHPYEGKELSKDHPIEKYLPKGDLVYPLLYRFMHLFPVPLRVSKKG